MPVPAKGGPSTTRQLSMAGNAVAMANASQAICRETADRLVRELLCRAHHLEHDPHHFAYFVGELTIFGSYLSDRPRINDIDVGYLLLPRFPDRERQRQFRKYRITAVIRGGRYFHSISEEVTSPAWEVVGYLTSRSSYYSLHRLEDERSLIESWSAPARLPREAIEFRIGDRSRFAPNTRSQYVEAD